MFKRIYLILISGAILVASPSAHNNGSNIKKIIKENGKVVVIIRENGKDKRVVLDEKALINMGLSSKNKSSKSKKNRVTKKSVKSKQSSKKLIAKKSSKKSSKSNAKKEVAKKSKKIDYKVSSGDTLFSIARKYKVSISDLVKLNKLGSSTLLQPGQVLKIPKKGYEEEAKEAVYKNKKTVYKVKRGDTLYSIARLYNMKPSTIRDLNNLKKRPKLKPGMELTVLGKPVLIEKRKHATKYVVKRGDTVWSIAKRNGLTIAQLKMLNPKIRRGLRRGDVLKVSKAEAVKLAKRLRNRKGKLRGRLAIYQKRYSSGGGSNSNVVRYAKRWLGSRYVWGASRPGAFDCSGFTSYVMKHARGKIIPRVSRRQAYYGKYVSRRNLRAGDLIFFDTSRSRRGYVNHVGIYIGNGKFIQASSAKHRVVITSLSKPFYSSRFMWGRRIY